MSALPVEPQRATLTHNPAMLLEPAVIGMMLALAWDQGNRRPRGEANPYRSDDE